MEIRKGVKQGDLSPNIFNAVLEEVFCNLNWTGKGLKFNGLNFNEYKNVNNRRFVDDIVISAKSFRELKAMAEDLRRKIEKVRLLINYSKTKIMSNISQDAEIKIENNNIETVSDYKYIG